MAYRWKTEIDGVLQMQHHFHWKHPLVLVDELDHSNQSEKAYYCSGCREMVSGPFFSCAQCNYHLHQKCAEAPYDIFNHPLHRQHLILILRSSPYQNAYCALCKEKPDMFFYKCLACEFSLDINCANLLSNKEGENIYQSVDDAHQLPFKFIENHRDKLKKVSCSYCHDPLLDSIFVSVDYKFFLHQSCFKLPTQIDHPSHRIHTLVLEFDTKSRFCKLCQKGDEEPNFFYHCSACNFNIHLKCVLPLNPVIEDRKYHEHPFTLLWRQHSFTCDACGNNGDFVSYVCLTCSLQLHEKCASLPRAIKFTRHEHPLFHKYSFKRKELDKYICQVCFEELKTEYGNYQCLKEDCNYAVHMECATGDSNLYEIFDPENEANLAEDVEPSFTVVASNEDGEAMKIRHFLHDDDGHELVLDQEKKIMDEENVRCNGCVLSITTPPFYYCSQSSECDFILHKACAELPRKTHHWYHRSPATLYSGEEITRCDFCYRDCNGFFYRISGLNLCVMCFKIPNIIKHEGHEHKLFFDHKWKKQYCNGCGESWRTRLSGAFRCTKKECRFTLDFACVTLPLEVKHKSEEHVLKLSYKEENEDREQQDCDICERKRDPNHWYYRCATCDNSAHTSCALGEYQFFKTGSTINFRWHDDHLVSRFARRMNYEYPDKCYTCDNHCDDVFLECATPTCKFIRHFDCPTDLERAEFDLFIISSQEAYGLGCGNWNKAKELAKDLVVIILAL